MTGEFYTTIANWIIFPICIAIFVYLAIRHYMFIRLLQELNPNLWTQLGRPTGFKAGKILVRTRLNAVLFQPITPPKLQRALDRYKAARETVFILIFFVFLYGWWGYSQGWLH